MIFPEIYFNDPAVTRVGDRGDVAYLIPYHSEESARTMRRENSKRLTSLNGVWDFKFYPAALDVDEHFYRTDFDTADFDKTEVPSVWQLQGYEKPIYLTSPYPIPFDPPNVPYANPMGAYVRGLTLNKKADKRYILCFEGVSTAYYLWVNGTFVGYAQVTHGESGFDVTDKLINGENRIAVAVLKWSDATYIEDQDMFRHNGIFRDVYLLERDENYIYDIRLETTLSKELSAGTLTLSPSFLGETRPVKIKVFSPAGELLYVGENKALTLERPLLWSAETPHLYTVTFTCGSEHFAMRTGFRTIEIADQSFLLNGRPIKFRGVNRHDSTPDKGFVMTYEEMRRDLLLMKEHNINAVRTSHYPAQPMFYELCDELGLYVMSEADMESHGCTYLGFYPYIAQDAQYRAAIVERGEKMVRQCRNFTSIVMWSLGNECSWGDNMKAEALAIRALDTRPVHYQGLQQYTQKFTDDDNMRLIEWKNSRNYVDVMSFFYPKYDLDYTLYESDPRPIIFGEYSHAMGNSCGDIWDYWQKILTSKQLAGGMIWEWSDHGIKRGEDMLYGGDFDEPYHAGEFCMDGLVSADRRPHTSLLEVKMAYAPVRIEAKDIKNGRFVLQNYNSFRAMGYARIIYSVEELGEVRESGTLTLDTPALGEELFTVSYDLGALRHRSYITFTVFEGEREVFTCQHQLPVKERYDTLPCGTEPLTVCDKNGVICIAGDGFAYAIDKYKGMLCGATVGDKELLTATADPIVCRVPLSNDRVLEKDWFTLAAKKPIPRMDLRTPTLFANYKATVQDAHCVTLSFDFCVTHIGEHPYVAGEIAYTVYPNGKLDITENGRVRRDMPEMFPRYGHLLKCDRALENLTYYGCGEVESYVDKHHFAKYGLYRTTVTARTVMDSEKPMEHGSIADTSFVALTDGDGDGLLFAGDGFSFHASHYDFYKMLQNDYRHRSELEIEEETFLILDRYMMGVGSHSCGPKLQAKYAATGGNYQFTMSVAVIKHGNDPTLLAKQMMTQQKATRSCFPRIAGGVCSASADDTKMDTEFI
ncbi:MAG: hypothetical protein IJW51_05255 [Clostridia bacterium]|nr:hypothetical protein [Clostridia bacterium]